MIEDPVEDAGAAPGMAETVAGKGVPMRTVGQYV
jgi:hypothetical protein